MKNCYLIFLLYFINLNSQENLKINTDLFIKENKYSNTLLQEKFFLHTNKTSYYSGEKIWFKAYVAMDINNKPFYKTSNLHVNLYNSNYKLIDHKMLFVKNGTTHGELELLNTLESGKYFIEINTLWNQNFKNKHITPIEIVNLNQKTKHELIEISKNKKNNANLDVSFFPESNSILEKTENNLVFTSKYMGKEISLNGKIINNETGRKIRNIKSNNLGIGSFKLLYFPNASYSVQVNYNGIEKNFMIPKAKKEGFILEKKKIQKNSKTIDFMLKTNSVTLSKTIGDYMNIVHHRKGYIHSVTPLQLDKNYTNYSISFLKKNLSKGINTLTVFNDKNEPILERKFYYKNKSIDLKFDITEKFKDSITVNITSLNSFTNTNISISVLPEKSKNYKNSKNILNDFLIKPYVHQKEIVANNYFNPNYSSQNIDNFLIASQNETYSFPNKQLNSISLLKLNSECGVTIKGDVYSYSKLKNKKVLLFSKENNLLIIKKLDSTNKFLFDSIYLKHPSNYKLSLLDEKDKVLKATFYVTKTIKNYIPDSILKLPKRFDKEKLSYVNNKKLIRVKEKNEIDKKINVLNEIIIVGKLNDRDNSDLLPNPKVLGSAFTKKYNIDENLYLGNNTALDLLKDLPGVQSNLYALRRGLTTVQSNRGQKSITGSKEMAILLNGSGLSDITVLSDINALDVKSIEINAMGASYGLIGANGVINVKTKAGVNYKNRRKSNAKNQKIFSTDFGFSSESKSFENYPLKFPNQDSKKYFATLDWIPNFIVKPNMDNYLKISTSNLKEIKLIINGFDKNGGLIYEEINLNLF
jgi:hypothetical protein